MGNGTAASDSGGFGPLLFVLLAASASAFLLLFLVRRRRGGEDEEVVPTQPDVFKDQAPVGPVVAAAAVAASPFDEDAPLASARPVAKGAPIVATAPLIVPPPPKPAAKGRSAATTKATAATKATPAATAAAAATAAEARPPVVFGAKPPKGVERLKVGYKRVRISAEPDEVRSPELGRLERGDEVEVLASHEGFLQVRTPEGITGWIRRTAILGGAS